MLNRKIITAIAVTPIWIALVTISLFAHASPLFGDVVWFVVAAMIAYMVATLMYRQ